MSALQKRQELLDAAAREFIECGYAATSLASVAGRLGLTKGALAHHFPTKKALLTGLADSFRHANREADRLSRETYPESGLHSAVAFMLHLGATAAQNVQVASALVLVTDRGTPSNEFSEVTLEWIK